MTGLRHAVLFCPDDEIPCLGFVFRETTLRFLIELRHEIEHQSTNRIDDALRAKLQACCINFNDVLKAEFGAQHAQ